MPKCYAGQAESFQFSIHGLTLITQISGLFFSVDDSRGSISYCVRRILGVEDRSQNSEDRRQMLDA